MEAVIASDDVAEADATIRLLRPIDAHRDHVRGVETEGAIVVVGYQDFLCPYCRRLRQNYERLRQALGDRLVYAFRHFPNERAHPGALLAARGAEAAARQGRFFEMHDRLFDRDPPFGTQELVSIARELGLDVARFERDLDDPALLGRIEEDLSDGRKNGVTGTPTLFVDDLRYDGAWDFQSMLEGLERPIAARVHRTARVFASLPTSAGLVLLVAAVLGVLCANTPLAAIYERLMSAHVGVGPVGDMLLLTVRDWLSEGLLAGFFLVVGLELRRDMTSGPLAEWRAATLPIVAALGGVVVPALIYVGFNPGRTAGGWPIPTATDVAFTLGVLAVLGDRIPTSLRVFVAALAVVDDVSSVLTLAVLSPRAFAPIYGLGVLGTSLVLLAFNRARLYAVWPYLVVSVGLWFSLHALGVHPALAGVLLAVSLPTRPAPSAAPLLAQAATALAALEHAEREARREGRSESQLRGEPIWEWTIRNLSAATSRLLSPADRIERAVAPWSAYLILPMFAFSATGVRITTDFSSGGAGRIFAGIVVALVIGKPLGILLASGLAISGRIAVAPEGLSQRQLVGAACLCGIGDTMALLMADRAFGPPEAEVAKLAVLVGSVIAGALGTIILRVRAVSATPSAPDR
jgi:NhaA family Na+:H+ antiporter